MHSGNKQRMMIKTKQKNLRPIKDENRWHLVFCVCWAWHPDVMLVLFQRAFCSLIIFLSIFHLILLEIALATFSDMDYHSSFYPLYKHLPLGATVKLCTFSPSAPVHWASQEMYEHSCVKYQQMFWLQAASHFSLSSTFYWRSDWLLELQR